MRRFFMVICLSALIFGFSSAGDAVFAEIYTGAFLGDQPAAEDIKCFQESFGKKPYLVMVYLDWERLVPDEVIKDVYGAGSALMVTLEPWLVMKNQAIDFNKIISGEYDTYLKNLAGQLKKINRPVFFRFAHEPDGNWYPWSGARIGAPLYISGFRHLRGIFVREGAANLRWIFSVNCEDVPRKNNHFSKYYPGDDYVDYVGIDGYNWGDTQPWSHWQSFQGIFLARYREIQKLIKKPVMITEFSTTSSGGEKADWIKAAGRALKNMPQVQGLILFNYDKETDWKFEPATPAGEALKNILRDECFVDGPKS